MQDTDVFVKTDAGRDEIRSRARGLSMPVRAILLMIDGQRTVAGMRALIAGSKAPPDTLDQLLAGGLITGATGSAPPFGAPPASTPAVSPPAAPPPPAPPPPASPPVAPPPVAPSPALSPPPRAGGRDDAPRAPLPPPALGRVSYDGPFDLVLATIIGEDEVPTPAAPRAAAPVRERAAVASPAEASPDRYNQLYGTMNEIVRDFLPAHRRYFFQLKIERCGTADELMVLLGNLHTALAKGRGEAFASDVIARLRSTAGY